MKKGNSGPSSSRSTTDKTVVYWFCESCARANEPKYDIACRTHFSEKVIPKLYEDTKSGVSAAVKTAILQDLRPRYIDPEILLFLRESSCLDPGFKVRPFITEDDRQDLFTSKVQKVQHLQNTVKGDMMAFGDCIVVLLFTITCIHAESRCIPNADCFYTFETAPTADCSSLNLQLPPCFDSSSNITHVNLRKNSLTRIPINLPPTLEYLDLSHNRVTLGDSPVLHTIYRRLKYLNLDSNRIKNLTSLFVISNMSNLEFLSLKDNSYSRYTKYPNNCLRGLESLFHLRIDGVGEGNFGDIFLEDKIGLKLLDASGNYGVCDISHLRPNILKKFNLTYLDLSFCNIKSIEIGVLDTQTFMQYLNVSHNPYLGFRGLANISKDLQSSAIKVLKFNKIHCTFGLGTILLLNHTNYLQNTTLEELYLDSNRLEIIESGVLPILPKTLKLLSVADNKVDNGLYVLQAGSMPNLEILNVSFQIHSHTTYFDGCYDYSDSCHIDPEVALKFHNWSQQLGYVVTFYLPVKLKRLYANNMKFQYHIGELHFNNCNLEFAHFQNNYFVQIHGPVFGCENARYIDLSNNFCSYISAQALKFLPNLNILNISQNHLGNNLEKDINGEIFGNNRNLRLLNLHDNKIYVLPENLLKNNSNIQILNISYNRMEKWTVDIRHMFQLQLLDLSYNLLTELDETAVNLLPQHNNFTINLLGNPLVCSCASQSFFEWLNLHHHARFMYLQNTTCSYMDGSQLSLRDISDIVKMLQKNCSSYTPLIIVTSSFIFFFLSVTIYRIIYRYRWTIFYIYYLTKRYVFPKVKQSQRKVFYEYDAFISYAEKDRSFVFNQIRLMENGEMKFCIHDRDFIPGIDIAENITNSIHNSRRIVFVMTSHFLKSYWCMFELNMARMESIYSRGGENILLLVLLENHIVREMPMSLLHVIESQSYLEYPDGDNFGNIDIFWRNFKDAIRDNQ
ncbi:toll-like receptor 4 [Saccostrea echinata]|uniref:toll-like receptor 4 n=1 Tax=Saccostrea echinata TaxID=191078 RepID=UPI002A7F2A71|nr:toll-like receptor 4 [Saccostrea echinata]